MRPFFFTINLVANDCYLLSTQFIVNKRPFFLYFFQGLILGSLCLASFHRACRPFKNIPHQPTTPQEDEFERWYQEAISIGLCQDLPKNYLSTQQGQIMVRVINENLPAGYELMLWRDAKALMENS